VAYKLRSASAGHYTWYIGIWNHWRPD